MTQIDSVPPEIGPEFGTLNKPDPSLQRLSRLVGTWEMRGRTLEAQEDDFHGRVTIEWMHGGYFLLQHGEIDIQGFKIHSLEVVGYDPATNTFPAYVFLSLGELPARYNWDIQGDTVTHWTEGSKYTGTFSPDENTLEGGWRPDEGVASTPGNTYDATMIRIK